MIWSDHAGEGCRRQFVRVSSSLRRRSTPLHPNGCIGFQVQALLRPGASYEQLTQTLAVAVYLGDGPSLMDAADTVQAWEESGGKQWGA